jgi:glycosyltransferase involved in cell wall biosynthesis
VADISMNLGTDAMPLAFSSIEQLPQMLPTVVVIIPCFNDGETLLEAVRSAQAQSRVDELVVVDDGSDDLATLNVLAALEAAGVVVVHRPNGGPGAARMSGVKASCADYILALDADDRLLPGAITALADELDSDPELALAWGDYCLFGQRSYRQQTAPTLDAWQIAYQNDLPSATMIRRSALLAAGGWEQSGGYEDWGLWMSFAESGAKGRRVERIIYEYRQHGSRRLAEDAARHTEAYALLCSRHAALLNARRAAWRRSSVPLGLRLSLPVIFVLPIDANRRRLLAGAACHLAYRRGIRTLVHRIAKS